MRILITGGQGQLGRALQTTLAEHELTSASRDKLDVTDRDTVFRVIREVSPQLVVHCAAYTNVDGCAKDPTLANQVNSLGTQNVALACQAVSAAMLHLSTNEVFAGDDPSGYEEWRPLNPINAYGRSKAAAESHVRRLLKRFYIVRTAWLYAPGGRNFIHAILNRARSNGRLRVVADEVGNPTYVKDLGIAIGQLIETEQYGIYHFVNAGSCSRWAFANEILRLAGLSNVENVPILLGDYKRASTPPPFAALHNLNGATIGINLRPWAEALAEYVTHET